MCLLVSTLSLISSLFFLTAAAGIINEVSTEVLQRVHALFTQHSDVRMRHLAFMLLARLGGRPPTLYVPHEELEAANAQGETKSSSLQ